MRDELVSVESEKLDEIVKTPPAWPVRMGISLISLLFLAATILSSFIRFPRTIEAEMFLQSDSPISRVFANEVFYIDSLLVKDQSEVAIGQPLLFKSSGIQRKTLTALESFLHLTIDPLIHLDSFCVTNDLAHELAADFTHQLLLIKNKQEEYKQFKIEVSSRNTVQFLTKRRQQLLEQLEIQRLELKLKKSIYRVELEKFHMDSLLFIDSVISRSEYLRSLEKILDRRSFLVAVKKELINKNITLLELEKELRQTESGIEMQEKTLESAIRTEVSALLNMIEKYRMEHTVIAPKDGKLTYSIELSKGRYIEPNTQLFSIESNAHQLIGIAEVESAQRGLLNHGQKVLVDFYAYPAFENGRVEGRLIKINPIHTNGKYRIHFELARELMSDRMISIPHLPEMKGKVRIICEEQSLLERVFSAFGEKLNMIN